MPLHFIITDQQAQKWNGAEKDVNVFHARKTSDGRWATDIGAQTVFPEAFIGDEPKVELGPEDFPQDLLM